MPKLGLQAPSCPRGAQYFRDDDVSNIGLTRCAASCEELGTNMLLEGEHSFRCTVIAFGADADAASDGTKGTRVISTFLAGVIVVVVLGIILRKVRRPPPPPPPPPHHHPLSCDQMYACVVCLDGSLSVYLCRQAGPRVSGVVLSAPHALIGAFWMALSLL